jgi:hypothetical protein
MQHGAVKEWSRPPCLQTSALERGGFNAALKRCFTLKPVWTQWTDTFVHYMGHSLGSVTLTFLGALAQFA